MRLSKTVNGITCTYLYNGDQLIQETIGDKILDFSYDASGTVYAVRYKENSSDSGTYFYYAHNTRGDVIALYTAGGNLYVKYNYDVWGNVLTSVTTTADNGVPAPVSSSAYVYDELNRCIKETVSEPNSDPVVTYRAYNPLGDVIFEKSGGDVTRTLYDKYGRAVQERLHGGRFLVLTI